MRERPVDKLFRRHAQPRIQPPPRGAADSHAAAEQGTGNPFEFGAAGIGYRRRQDVGGAHHPAMLASSIQPAADHGNANASDSKYDADDSSRPSGRRLAVATLRDCHRNKATWARSSLTPRSRTVALHLC